jgi:hypothetical protein
MIHLEVENVAKTRDNGRRIIDEWIWGEQVNEHDVKLTLQQREIFGVNQHIAIEQYVSNHRPQNPRCFKCWILAVSFFKFMNTCVYNVYGVSLMHQSTRIGIDLWNVFGVFAI